MGKWNLNIITILCSLFLHFLLCIIAFGLFRNPKVYTFSKTYIMYISIILTHHITWHDCYFLISNLYYRGLSKYIANWSFNIGNIHFCILCFDSKCHMICEFIFSHVFISVAMTLYFVGTVLYIPSYHPDLAEDYIHKLFCMQRIPNQSLMMFSDDL